MTDVRTDGQRKRVFIRTYGCQMNVYDSDRMADVLRPLGYALADDAGAGRPGRAEHLPHPRARLGEGLFRAGPPARHQARAPRRGPRPHHRRRRLRRPGRGRGDRAPPARRRHRGRAAGLSPPAAAAGRGRAQGGVPAAPASACRAPACSTPISRPRASSTTCRRRRACAPARPSCRSRKAATSSAPSASCPIRAAPNIRGRPRERAGRSAPARRQRARSRSRCSARTSTPITARRRTARRGRWRA